MAARFWVGGTGPWDASTTTHWSATTGGAGGASAPTTGDSVTFDASSGGGTVTADTTINNLSLADITSGAFTGTLDFSVNNPNITLTSTTGFNASGSGVRKYLMGSGTFTFTGTGGFLWFLSGSNIDGTSNFAANYTFTANTTTTKTFTGAGKTYGTLTVSANTSRGMFDMVGANTFSNIVLAAGTNFRLAKNTTITISNPFTWTGTSSLPINLFSDNPSSGGAPTISIASGTSSLDWGGVYEIAVTGGGTFNATNSFDFGRRSGWTSFSAPSAGGGGAVVGMIGG